MTANGLNLTANESRYREVILTPRSADELQRELARYNAGMWQLVGVYDSSSPQASTIKVTLILEQVGSGAS